MRRQMSPAWMWAQACAAIARAEHLHRELFEIGAGGPDTRPAWEAPVDVFERGPELTVWVALPGVAPDTVEVHVDGSLLLVAGVRRVRVEPPAAVVRRLEIPHGRFERRLRLPSAGYRVDGLEAVHGCLRLRLRRG